jgi:hypothetical protein
MLIEIAREVISESKENAESKVMAVLFLERLKELSPDLYEQKASEAMLFWAEDQMRKTYSADRRLLEQGDKPRYVPPHARQPLNASTLESMQKTWMHYRLYGGRQLGHARKPEVLASAEAYTQIGKKYTAIGNFNAAVAAKMRNDTATVAESWSVSDLARLAAQHGVLLA